MAEVVVVGAGLGGLAAAARLAAAGHAVTVCEQAPEVGGKLGKLARDGFTFDTGPSLLTMPQVFRELFDATGAPLDDVLPLLPVDPIARYRFADGTRLDAWTDPVAFRVELDRALGVGAGTQWAAYERRGAAIYDAVRERFLERPLGGPADLLRMATDASDLLTVAPLSSMRGLARRYLHDPRLRMLADRYATYTGSDPRRAPAALTSVPFVERRFGAWYVPGGLHRLAVAVADRARRCGARILTGVDVTAVTMRGGRVTGVSTSGAGRMPGDVVVANADAAHLYGDLLLPRPGRRLAGAVAGRLRRQRASLSGFVLLLGVRGRTPDLAHHTVLFPADYDAEFDALFGRRPRPVQDPTVYVAVPRDPAVAPEGHEAWFVLVNAPRQDQVDWDAPGLAESYADRVLAVLAARGLDVRDRLRFRAVRTPADLARRTRAVGGAIYGSSSNGAVAAFLRPRNVTPVRGLYLVGGSSHPGGGLPLVALSARIVAELIGRP